MGRRGLATLLVLAVASLGHADPSFLAGVGSQPTAAANPCSFIGTTAPALATTGVTNGSTAAASPLSFNMPATISSGDALLAIVRNNAGSAGTGFTFPAGWTEIYEGDSADGSDDLHTIAWREADGTEGATINVSFDGGGSVKYAGLILRITGAVTLTNKAPDINTSVTGTTATPDPGNNAPTCGSKDYLWVWMGGWEGEQTSPPTGNPTSYTGAQGANSGTASTVPTNMRVAISTRQLTAASEDPGSWTISAADNWTAHVVAVAPD